MFSRIPAVAALAALAGIILLSSIPVVQAGRKSGGTPNVRHNLPPAPHVERLFASSPLRFEPNVGQAPGDFQYVGRGPGYTLLLGHREAAIRLGSGSSAATVRMDLKGAASAAVSHPDELLGSVTHYYIGDDPKQWHPNVPNYGRVKFDSVYPGIDVVYYGTQQRLEYDFIVRPGADPAQVRMTYAGVDSMHVDARGDLLLNVRGSELRTLKPVVYQVVAGKRIHVDGHYQVSNGEVAFAIGHYDRSRELVVDPGIIYSTYLGGNTLDQATGIAVDTNGSAYVTGFTAGGFPTASAEQGTYGGLQDAVVAKFNSSGVLVYSTYLGGATLDKGAGIAVDSSGAAYVTGKTSGSFPLLNAAQSTFGGVSDAFVTKLNPSGTLSYSTYFGGATDDQGNAIAVDDSGEAFITGTTNGGLPTLNAAQPVYSGAVDAFVAKFTAAGALSYATYLGGGSADAGTGIAVDKPGNAYVTGSTGGNFPTLNAYQSSYGGGASDAFVAKLSTTGSFAYKTYLGGATADAATAIAADQAGVVFLTGNTAGSFPLLNAAQSTFGGVQDAFVASFNGNGLLAYSTYLGGVGSEQAAGIAVDVADNVFVTGSAVAGFPLVSSIQPFAGGGTDAYVAHYSPSGALVYSTYLGGSGSDLGLSIATDGSGNAFVAGGTTGGFPTKNAAQGTFGGSQDMFVAELSSATPLTLLSLSPNSGPVAGQNLSITINGTGFYPGPQVLFNGVLVPTTFVNPTKLIISSIGGGLLNAPGTVNVSFDNSNTLKFNVLAPVVSVMGPTSVGPGSGPLSINLAGANYVASSKVVFNGTTLTSTVSDSGHISATIPQSLLTDPKVVAVTVTSPGAVSNSVPFIIGSPEMNCQLSNPTPNNLRFEGDAELLGDIILSCTGQNSGDVNTNDIVVTANVNLTSRIIGPGQLTEAYALVGDPPAAQQKIGTNVFQGTLTNASTITFKGVVTTIPDLGAPLIIRLVNVRANAHQLGQSSFKTPPTVNAAVALTPTLVLGNPQLSYGIVSTGIPVQLGAAISSLADERSIQVVFTEPFANAFKTRVAAGGNQSTPGQAYNTESGFVNTALSATAGLATSATRLLVKFSGVPSGVKAYASVFPDTNTNAQLVATDANGANTGASTSFIAGVNLFGGKYSQVTLDANGNGVAVWEVTSAVASAVESFPFHIVLTGMIDPGLGTIRLQGGPAPLSTVTTATQTDPLPRFAADALSNFIGLSLQGGGKATTNVGTLALTGYHPSDLRGRLQIQDTLPQVQVGSNLGFTYNVVNNGPGPANQVTVSTNLPSSLSYLSCSTSTGGICSPTTNTDGSTTVTAEYMSAVEPGQTNYFDVQATASFVAPAVPVTAVLSNSVTDSAPDDNIVISNFAISTTKPPPVSVTFVSVPDGLLLQPVTTPPTAPKKSPLITVDQATPISYIAPTPQADAVVAGKQYAFRTWNDGETNPTHPLAAPPIGGGTITATFDTQYRLTVSPSPALGGTVSISPASASGFYTAGAPVQITASPAPGYTFTGFSGDVVTTDGNPVLNYVIPQKQSSIQANFLFTNLALSPSSLFYGSTPGAAAVTSTQTVNVIAPPTANWTVSANQAFISVTPTSGKGSGSFTVSMVTSKLPASGTVSGIVTVTSTGVGNSPQTVNVSATIVPGGTPFGSFDTPADNSTGISGAVAVTGWALDSVEVTNVEILREPVGTEPAQSNGLVFIGNAVFVVGARPDVQAANPSTPFNYRAGWGYLLLTTGLPPNGGATVAGNGTYKLHAIAHSKTGSITDLGTKTITVDNAHSTKPFGTIDTPDQGGTVSGNQFINFGWTLAQNPNCIPKDGSLLTITVDGVTLGHPTYNQNRADLAAAFPGRCNSLGAAGYFFLDTTKLSNGVHTIGWLSYDDHGNGDGLGSRFFSVLNTGASAAPEEAAPAIEPRDVVTLTRGYSLKRKAETLAPGKDGVRSIEIEELDRIELDAGITGGYLLVGDERQPLPAGSTVQGGVFYWQLAPAFLGRYDLVFERAAGNLVRVRVLVRTKTFTH